MRRCRGVYKNPNGKLVVIDIRVINNQVIDLEISGDFFAYPEDAIDVLEENLKGLDLSCIENVLLEKSSNIIFIGLEVGDLIKALRGVKCIEETPLGR